MLSQRGTTKMNRIYKIVFNYARGQYQVVSELAKSKGKAPGSLLARTVIKSGGVLIES